MTSTDSPAEIDGERAVDQLSRIHPFERRLLVAVRNWTDTRLLPATDHLGIDTSHRELFCRAFPDIWGRANDVDFDSDRPAWDTRAVEAWFGREVRRLRPQPFAPYIRRSRFGVAKEALGFAFDSTTVVVMNDGTRFRTPITFTSKGRRTENAHPDLTLSGRGLIQLADTIGVDDKLPPVARRVDSGGLPISAGRWVHATLVIARADVDAGTDGWRVSSFDTGDSGLIAVLGDRRMTRSELLDTVGGRGYEAFGVEARGDTETYWLKRFVADGPAA